jgi:hypothetical protein
MKEVLRDVEKRMIGAVEAYQTELAKLRTGRASLALIDGITVDYYGSQTPLNQVAALSVPDPTTIFVRSGVTETTRSRSWKATKRFPRIRCMTARSRYRS